MLAKFALISQLKTLYFKITFGKLHLTSGLTLGKFGFFILVYLLQ